jgi:DNA-binding transcriptional MocR family regulator
MPINSFDNYPMSWRPDKREIHSPVYRCLADMLERDIKDGTLPPNTKLPPQRELADFLDLNLTTVTRAYKLCEERGLIHAVIGKGTFVVPHANVLVSVAEKDAHPDIEMGTIHPFYEHNELVRQTALDVLRAPSSADLLDYAHPLGTSSQLEAGVQWLRSLGVDGNLDTVLPAAGVQGALAALLASLFEPGARLAVDLYTYSNFISLANLLHLQLVGVAGDEEGMRPDLLDELCTMQGVQGMYIMPSGNNPTNVSLSDSRKKELAKVIQKHHLLVLEDDNYSALYETPPLPLSSLIPEQGIYISGLSKPLCAGLRVAYLRMPEPYMARVGEGIFSQTLKISGLSLEIAARLIKEKTAERIVRGKRNFSLKRNRIYSSVFPGASAHPFSYCQWLEIPEGVTGMECEKALKAKGVSVFGAERFSVNSMNRINFIRVATCSPNSEKELKTGLLILRRWMESKRR